MSSSRTKTTYSQAQAELEEIVNSIAASNGFHLDSRNANFGKGCSVSWTRQVGWRVDELRLLFLWSGRLGYRGVYADLGTKALLDDKAIAVDGYPTAWIARNSSDELKLRETDQHAPARLAQTLRSDIIASIAWVDRTYSSPAAALQRLGSGDRNGVRVGTPHHRAIIAQLERLAGRA